MLRRLFLPAILAVPIWLWALIAVLRPASFEFEHVDLATLAFGTVFDCAGILLVCLPTARPIAAWKAGLATKFGAFIAVGAAGGFGILAIIGLAGSILDGMGAFEASNALLGLLGMLPGAVTAAFWFVINRDIFFTSKDASVV